MNSPVFEDESLLNRLVESIMKPSGDRKHAEEELKRRIDAAKNNEPEGCCALGMYLMLIDEDEYAVDFLRTSAGGGMIEGRATLALALNITGRKRFEEAEKIYLDLIDSSDTDAYLDLASLYEDQGRFKEAEKIYLYMIDCGNTDAYFDLASMYKDQGRLEEAEKIYREFAEKGNEKGLRYLAYLLDDMGRTEEAQYYYDLLVNMNR